MINPHIGVEREEFIRKNLRLVEYIVYRWYLKTAQLQGIDPEDLIQIGSMGLFRAYDMYDPTLKKFSDRKPEFKSYASRMIRGRLNNYVRDYSMGPKFTRTAKNVAYQMRKFPSAPLDLTLNPKEVAEALGIREKDAMQGIMYTKYSYVLSFDVELAELELEGETLHAIVPSKPLYEPKSKVEIAYHSFLTTLSERYATTLRMHVDGYNQYEISNVIGVKQAQISRDLKRLIANFRQYYEEYVYV